MPRSLLYTKHAKMSALIKSTETVNVMFHLHVYIGLCVDNCNLITVPGDKLNYEHVNEKYHVQVSLEQNFSMHMIWKK